MIIDIIVFDGVDELDALGPLEVFRNAERLGADVSARLVTREAQPIVRGSFGLRFAPDHAYEPREAEVLVVPGGGWVARAEVGAWAEYRLGHWLPLLAEAAGTARVMAGVCTGSMLLAHAGVIGRRPAATHHGAWLELEATGALVVKERVVDDGDLVTSSGVTSGIDLALWLVQREVSADCAEQIATRIEYAWQRPRRNGPTFGSLDDHSRSWPTDRSGSPPPCSAD
jgi:transcriptional regulator GlxA family with amidase domain